MEIKFDSDDKIPLNKQLKFLSVTIVIRSVFEDGKYYPHVSLDVFYMNYKMLEYDRRDISEGIYMNKTSSSKECDICQYWYFLDKSFNYEPYLCNGCHDLMQKAMNFNDVAIVSIKKNDYRIHFWYMSKDEAISVMHNSSQMKKNGLL